VPITYSRSYEATDYEGELIAMLKRVILHQLREMQREMALAISGLSSEHLEARLPGRRNSIAWIVQHCCANVDIWLHRSTMGEFAIQHTDRFITWPVSPPEEGESFPDANTLLDRWARATEAGISAIASLDDSQLLVPGQALGKEAMVQSCLRVLNHQNAHLRQIWMMLGSLGLSDAHWPSQGTWLAYEDCA
jgi:uncharacterized damage-inducible protein DinB